MFNSARGLLSAFTALSITLFLIGNVSSAFAQSTPVAVARAETVEIVNPVRLNGSVVSPRVARVSTDIGGLISEVLIDLGDRVEAGTPLARLDPRMSELDLQSAVAERHQAEAQLQDALRRLSDAERLAERNTISQNEVEAREVSVQVARANLERYQAAEARALEILERHVIRAPFAAVVSRKATEAGEWIDPGAAVVELVMTQGLLIEAPVPQRYFASVHEDIETYVSFDAAQGGRYPAEIVARIPVSDPNARTFRLRLAPLGDLPPLAPGMSARVSLRLSTGQQGLVVPRDALVRFPDGRIIVWEVVNDGDQKVARERQVEIGQMFDGMVEVIEGLQPGALLVVRGNESLSAGQEIEIVEGAG